MNRPDLDTLFETIEATWPPARKWSHAGLMVRDGAGGGKRVAAATLDGPLNEVDFAAFHADNAARNLPDLCMVRTGQDGFDAALEAQGYTVIDPVVLYVGAVADIAKSLPPVTCFATYPPLGISMDIWDEGGIGPARRAVMDRVPGAKTSILGRARDHAAGVGFVAMHQKTAMVHALEVKTSQRRQGAAVNIMCAAANWAQDQGAEWLAVVVTRANHGANKLYSSLNMQPVGHYHYRIKDPKRATQV